MKSWRQVVIDVQPQFADAFSSLLTDQGALGLEIIDDTTRAMPGAMARLNARTTLVAPFEPREGLERDISAEVARLMRALDGAPDVEIAWSTLDEEDWNATFKQGWAPFFLAEDVVVVPSWAEQWPPAGTELFIDPGAAFGTGTHETTQLCARLLLDHLAVHGAPPAVLDVGTGSGILSLLALKRGVPRAAGTEIDPVALDAARANMDANGVGERFVGWIGNPDETGERFALALANILIDPLLHLAPAIARAVRPGGILIASGILVSQAEALEKAYVAQGFVRVSRETLGEWAGVKLQRAASDT